MSSFWQLVKEYDEELYRRLQALFSEQEVIEKSLQARAPSYNEGLLAAAEDHLRFLESVEKFFSFDEEASAEFLNKQQSAEFNLLIAQKRVAEQKAREALRNRKSPAQILYQKLSHEFNQFQLGLQSLDDTTKAVESLSAGIKDGDIELVNIRDSFITKINYVREQTDKENARKVTDLESSLYRKLQFYRAGMISFDQYIAALKTFVAEGQAATDQEDPVSKAKVSTGQEAQQLIEQAERNREKNGLKRQEEEIQTQLRVSQAKLSIITNEEERKLAAIELSYRQKKVLIEQEVKDETEKAGLILQLDRAMQYELEQARLKQSLGFQTFLAASKSAFSGLWTNLIVGQRQAKDEWDQLWLDMKNSALRRIYELLEQELMDYLFDVFVRIGLDIPGAFPGAAGGDILPGSPVPPLELTAVLPPPGSTDPYQHTSSMQTERLIKRLDNLEAAIINKSWEIKGEDIHAVNKIVETRRATNAL